MTFTGSSSLATSRANADFARAMSVPEALLGLRDHVQAPHSPFRDVGLNRSVVVLCVASWQTWVETYVGTAIVDVQNLPASRTNDKEYLQLVHSIGRLTDLALNEVANFSTPNAANVCRMLGLIGDDPRPRWTFSSNGGQRSPNDVIGRLDDWVKVRHHIAHGHRHLPAVGVLTRTRAGHGSLTHRCAAQCVAFFRQLADATGQDD